MKKYTRRPIRRVKPKKATIQKKGSSQTGGAYSHTSSNEAIAGLLGNQFMLQKAAFDKKNKEESDAFGGAPEKNAPSTSLLSSIKSKRGGGNKLPKETQSEMEKGFGGEDFSDVRVHTDSDSVQMNKNMGAKAFTNEKDIHFNSGEFAPDTKEGKHLLAHELTHVVQQKTISDLHTKLNDPVQRSSYEVEADRSADMIVGGGSINANASLSQVQAPSVTGVQCKNDALPAVTEKPNQPIDAISQNKNIKKTITSSHWKIIYNIIGATETIDESFITKLKAWQGNNKIAQSGVLDNITLQWLSFEDGANELDTYVSSNNTLYMGLNKKAAKNETNKLKSVNKDAENFIIENDSSKVFSYTIDSEKQKAYVIEQYLQSILPEIEKSSIKKLVIFFDNAFVIEKCDDLLFLRNKDTFDELLQIVKQLHEASTGKKIIKRVILSGHSGGVELTGDGDGEVSFKQLLFLKETSLFDKGFLQVEDLMVSACNAGYKDHVNQYLKIFPRARCIWGYANYSPAGNIKDIGSNKDLKLWEAATKGKTTPKSVSDARKDSDDSYRISTWTRTDNKEDATIKDGEYTVSETFAAKNIADLEKDYKSSPYKTAYINAFHNGKIDKQPLNSYYILLTTLVFHHDRNDLETERTRTSKLRKWNTTDRTNTIHNKMSDILKELHTEEQRQRLSKIISTKEISRTDCLDFFRNIDLSNFKNKEWKQNIADWFLLPPEISKLEEKDDEVVQPQMEPGQVKSLATLSKKNLTSAGSGSPLPKDIQTKMEKGFGGEDFSEVRIHTSSKSSELNDALGARAFTNGKDIHFNKGQFAPNSQKGNHLLAHELTHVVQQRSVPDLQTKLTDPLQRNHFEVEAEKSADSIASGNSVKKSSLSLVSSPNSIQLKAAATEEELKTYLSNLQTNQKKGDKKKNLQIANNRDFLLSLDISEYSLLINSLLKKRLGEREQSAILNILSVSQQKAVSDQLINNYLDKKVLKNAFTKEDREKLDSIINESSSNDEQLNIATYENANDYANRGYYEHLNSYVSGNEYFKLQKYYTNNLTASDSITITVTASDDLIEKGANLLQMRLDNAEKLLLDWGFKGNINKKLDKASGSNEIDFAKYRYVEFTETATTTDKSDEKTKPSQSPNRSISRNELKKHIKNAQNYINKGIEKLNSSNGSTLKEFFGDISKESIIIKLQAISAQLYFYLDNYEDCTTCDETTIAVNIGRGKDSELKLGQSFLNETDNRKKEDTLIHEAVHAAIDGHDYAYEHERILNLPVKFAIQNPDSYILFLQKLHTGKENSKPPQDKLLGMLPDQEKSVKQAISLLQAYLRRAVKKLQYQYYEYKLATTKSSPKLSEVSTILNSAIAGSDIPMYAKYGAMYHHLKKLKSVVSDKFTFEKGSKERLELKNRIFTITDNFFTLNNSQQAGKLLSLLINYAPPMDDYGYIEEKFDLKIPSNLHSAIMQIFALV